MARVISEPCIGVKDNSCVEVCPVDCIHPPPDEPDYDHPDLEARAVVPSTEQRCRTAIRMPSRSRRRRSRSAASRGAAPCGSAHLLRPRM
jgi:NAD-dependent dihydropyrimidine dehydrogenase PreA subunit